MGLIEQEAIRLGNFRAVAPLSDANSIFENACKPVFEARKGDRSRESQLSWHTFTDAVRAKFPRTIKRKASEGS